MYASIQLRVPYVSQYGPGADAFGKDCGPTCGVMLLAAYTGERMTPDAFYSQISAEDTYLSRRQVGEVLQSKGVDWENRRDLTLDDLYRYLQASKPCIALINYGVLREHIETESTFTGPHFVLVVGMDQKHVYVHDPLWRETGGAWLPVPHVAWRATWERAKEQLTNPPCSLLIPATSLPTQHSARVLVYWEQDEYYYPALIVQYEGEDYLIRYDDGSEEWTTPDCIEPFEFNVGDEVECLYSDGDYYSATIKQLKGEQVEIEYAEDGSHEWTTTSQLRVWYD